MESKVLLRGKNLKDPSRGSLKVVEDDIDVRRSKSKVYYL